MRLPARLALASLVTLGCTPNSPTAPDSASTPPSQAERGPIILARAEPSDLIVIQVASQGCYHDHVVDVKVRRSSEEVFEVTARASTRYPFGRGPRVAATTTVRFSPQDIAALDRYLQLYRTASNSGLCTTRTQVRVSHVHDGVVQHSESLEDTSCEVYNRARGRLPVAFNNVLEAALDQL